MLTIAGGILLAIAALLVTYWFLIAVANKVLRVNPRVTQVFPIIEKTPKYTYDANSYGGVRKNY